MKLVFATNNLNKLSEVQNLISEQFKLLSLSDIACFEDIPETSKTLKGNALLKAEHVYNKYGFNCFADDTGLEVEALDGAPGVYSARYAGADANAENNMQKLLTSLEGCSNRKARFVTVIALLLDGNQYFFEGQVEGLITNQKSGVAGFGYDPIFKPNGFDVTFAEMSQLEKGKISHRGRAISQLTNYLKTIKP